MWIKKIVAIPIEINLERDFTKNILINGSKALGGKSEKLPIYFPIGKSLGNVKK